MTAIPWRGANATKRFARVTKCVARCLINLKLLQKSKRQLERLHIDIICIAKKCGVHGQREGKGGAGRLGRSASHAIGNDGPAAFKINSEIGIGFLSELIFNKHDLQQFPSLFGGRKVARLAHALLRQQQPWTGGEQLINGSNFPRVRKALGDFIGRVLR